MRRALWRSILGVVLFAITFVVLRLLGRDPEPVRVVLLVLLASALLWLVLDVLSTTQPGPHLHADPGTASAGNAQDPRTAALVRMLEFHRTARAPDRHLQSQLTLLADRRLLHVHGVRREVEPDRARSLLGPDLTDVIEGPTIRLNAQRINTALRRIEEM